MNFSIPTGEAHRSFPFRVIGKVLAAVGLILSLCLFGYYTHALLLKYPPVWPDEAIYSNSAIDLIRHGVLGFTLFGDIVPGAVRHSFLVPLVYVAYSWVIFSISGIGIVQARLGSVAAALAVMFLTYGIARRSGLSSWTAMVPVSLLAIDTLFVRGAMIARADMLELALLLLSFWLVAPSLNLRTVQRPMRLFCAGAASGLALLMPPTGTVVSIVFLAALVVAFAGNRRTTLLPLAGGVLAPVLPWFGYSFLHWREFVLQFGTQAARKADRHPLTLHQLASSLHMDMSQYGQPSVFILLAWIAGLYALLLVARRSRFVGVLAACQIAIFAVLIWGDEMWYGLYLVPLTMIGLVHLATLAADGAGWRTDRRLLKIAGWMSVFTALWMVQNSLVMTSSFNYAVNDVFARETDYASWAQQVSKAIPRGSTVLLSVTPDPYFVLRDRPDLTLREFIPGFKLDKRTEMAYMESADYILVRGPLPNKNVWRFVHAHAQLMNQVGSPFGWGYRVGVYKVIKRKKQTGAVDVP